MSEREGYHVRVEAMRRLQDAKRVWSLGPAYRNYKQAEKILQDWLEIVCAIVEPEDVADIIRLAAAFGGALTGLLMTPIRFMNGVGHLDSAGLLTGVRFDLGPDGSMGCFALGEGEVPLKFEILPTGLLMSPVPSNVILFPAKETSAFQTNRPAPPVDPDPLEKGP